MLPLWGCPWGLGAGDGQAVCWGVKDPVQPSLLTAAAAGLPFPLFFFPVTMSCRRSSCLFLTLYHGLDGDWLQGQLHSMAGANQATNQQVQPAVVLSGGTHSTRHGAECALWSTEQIPLLERSGMAADRLVSIALWCALGVRGTPSYLLGLPPIFEEIPVQIPSTRHRKTELPNLCPGREFGGGTKAANQP